MAKPVVKQKYRLVYESRNMYEGGGMYDMSEKSYDTKDAAVAAAKDEVLKGEYDEVFIMKVIGAVVSAQVRTAEVQEYVE